jgi:hypothetical protein
MRDPEAQLLRRYVLERAAGRIPTAEYVRLEEVAPGVGGWIRCDEKTARESEHWRRLRKPGGVVVSGSRKSPPHRTGCGVAGVFPDHPRGWMAASRQ